MTEPKQHKEVTDDTKISMTALELKEMILAGQRETAQVIADALIKSRQPYVDPKQAEIDEMFRKSSRETEERKRQAVYADQKSCEHLQGSNALSEMAGQLTSIVWHDLGNGVMFGLCTNCIRQFWPGDPDYVSQYRRKSGNKPSAAGQRRFLIPTVPQVGRPGITTPEASVDVPDHVAQ